jgi:hypothetical protein
MWHWMSAAACAALGGLVTGAHTRGMRVPQNALNTAGPESGAASAEPEAAKAVLAPLQPLRPSDRHPIRMIVVLQESRDIFETGKGLRVMEIPLGTVGNEGFGWSRTRPGARSL